MTSRRVLTWTFELRTPFNSMSDAARMEATRLAPAGRACSKFVWQSRFLENWAVRASCARAALSFLAIATASCRRGVAAVTILPGDSTFRASSNAALMRSGDSSRSWTRSVQRLLAPGAGHVVAAIRGHSSAAEMRRMADRRDRISAVWAHRRATSWSTAGSEFVSEFETKRDQ